VKPIKLLSDRELFPENNWSLRSVDPVPVTNNVTVLTHLTILRIRQIDDQVVVQVVDIVQARHE
jgi:hypothetical protein